MLMKRVKPVTATVLGLVILGAQVLAQQPQKTFTQLPGGVTGEPIPAAPLVFFAYGFVWFALLTYIFLLWRRMGRVERELADVTARLQSRALGK
jgi:CcmD family protein